MPQTEPAVLTAAIKQNWPKTPTEKSRRYVGKFFDRVRTGKKIVAKVEGNHGIYTVSITAKGADADAACSCYIGGDGYCHHCHALALTFLKEAETFTVVKEKNLKEISAVSALPAFLRGKSLDALLTQLKELGITQKALAQGMGMSSRHLAAINSSEKRNRYFNELGATKLACLWVLEHCLLVWRIAGPHHQLQPGTLSRGQLQGLVQLILDWVIRAKTTR